MIAKAITQPPRMNGTEEKYAWYLDVLRQGGEIISWKFQPVALLLGHDLRYTPDFMVISKEGFIEMHEVKGFMRDDALVKLKVAARELPFRFVVVRWANKQWDFQDVKP